MIRKLTIINIILLLLASVNQQVLAQSWTQVASYTGATNYVRAVTYLDANNVIAVGGSTWARVRKSTDGGATWTTTLLASSVPYYNLYAVCFTNTTTGYAVGNLGEILYSTDAGSNWSFQSNPIYTEGLYQLYGVSFNSINGIAVGQSGRITWTSNGGSNWNSPATNPAGSNDLYGVSFYNSTNAVAVGLNGLIIKSTDGGNNWTSITTTNTNTLIAVRFLNGSTGIAVGTGGTVLRTTDGGDTWTSTIAISALNVWRAISFYDATHGVIAGDGPSIAKTIDGGQTWSSLPATDFTNMTFIDGVAFIDQDHGIAAASNNTDMQGYIFYTLNAGLPVELSSFTATAANTVATLQWNTATEVNNYGFEVERRVVESVSSGVVEWSKVGFVTGNGTSNSAHSYKYTDANVATGTYAYRLKQIDNSGTYKYSSEAEVSIAVPKVFALNQNYPNPFNPTTMISFTLAKDGFTTLKIYDILGKEVSTLVNSEMKAGIQNTVTFDASKLSSGIYFSRLENNGNAQIKKLVLMK
jgi:photosystem II stability/assembly factor-like uncharacterized protein